MVARPKSTPTVLGICVFLIQAWLSRVSMNLYWSIINFHLSFWKCLFYSYCCFNYLLLLLLCVIVEESGDDRLGIVKELLRTEDTYLENLRNIFDIYMEPLK